MINFKIKQGIKIAQSSQIKIKNNQMESKKYRTQIVFIKEKNNQKDNQRILNSYIILTRSL